MNAGEDVSGGDERARVEGYLGERDDGDTYAHENGKSARVAARLENVRGNGVLDAVTEHEDTDYGKTCVEDVLRDRVLIELSMCYSGVAERHLRRMKR